MLPIPLGDEPRPERYTPVVNWVIVLANLVVYMLTTSRAETEEELAELFRAWGFTPASPRLTTLFTSMFVHANAIHLIGNMLFLWIFGTNTEWCLGRVGYLAAYLATGLVGTLAFWAFGGDSDIPAVGASGAISGVLGVYLIAFPRNRVRLLFFLGFVIVGRCPAWILLGLWFLVQDVVPVVFGEGLADGVAHTAHLGGFAAGIAVALVVRRLAARTPSRPPPSAAARRGWEKYL